MYDLFDFRPDNKEMAIGILVGIIVLVVVFCTGYLFGLRNAGTGVSDNGIRVEDVREQLSTAVQHQQQITSGLAGAVERSDTAAARAGRIEERAGAAAQSVGDAGKLIDECQQIVGTIRNRGKKNQAKN